MDVKIFYDLEQADRFLNRRKCSKAPYSRIFRGIDVTSVEIHLENYFPKRAYFRIGRWENRKIGQIDFW